MPLSYQGFGFTGILLMVLVVIAAQAYRYLKDRAQSHDPDSGDLRIFSKKKV